MGERASRVRARWLAAALAGAAAWATVGGASPSAEPSSPGLSPADHAAIATAATDLPRLHSLLVSWRGSLIVEQYFNRTTPNRPANIKSASKSLISALVGIAIDRGYLTGVTQPIGSFFDDALSAPADAARRQITIENLLTMQSGLASTSNRNYGAWVQSPNWVRHALRRPFDGRPGLDMVYSTGNSHLLSAILTKATGRSTWQFAQETLARPLGFSLAQWPRDPQGIYFGGNDMLLTPRQMVAFGELFLERGTVRGRQIVSAAWIEQSFVPRTRSRISGQLYGYGWWIREMAGVPVYVAWGFGGQYIVVVPDLELVVASTSASTVADDRRTHRRTVDDLIERLVMEPIAAASARDVGHPSS